MSNKICRYTNVYVYTYACCTGQYTKNTEAAGDNKTVAFLPADFDFVGCKTSRYFLAPRSILVTFFNYVFEVNWLFCPRIAFRDYRRRLSAAAHRSGSTARRIWAIRKVLPARRNTSTRLFLMTLPSRGYWKIASEITGISNSVLFGLRIFTERATSM